MESARKECPNNLKPPDLWTLSIVRNSKYLGEKMFRKVDLFPYSGEGKINIYSVGSLRKS
jgi:hypothetical protein